MVDELVWHRSPNRFGDASKDKVFVTHSYPPYPLFESYFCEKIRGQGIGLLKPFFHSPHQKICEQKNSLVPNQKMARWDRKVFDRVLVVSYLFHFPPIIICLSHFASDFYLNFLHNILQTGGVFT